MIWGGVVTGMEVCQSSETPMASLGEFLGKLIRMGWHPADVRSVKLNILELLRWKIATANPPSVGQARHAAPSTPGDTSASAQPGGAVRFWAVNTQSSICDQPSR
jgi:hypothetical protein